MTTQANEGWPQGWCSSCDRMTSRGSVIDGRPACDTCGDWLIFEGLHMPTQVESPLPVQDPQELPSWMTDRTSVFMEHYSEQPAPELPVRPQEEFDFREAIRILEGCQIGSVGMGYREACNRVIDMMREALKPSNPAPTSESQAAPRQDGKR